MKSKAPGSVPGGSSTMVGNRDQGFESCCLHFNFKTTETLLVIFKVIF